MSKAAAAFRTISEVAEELDVPKHVLRFWELKFPQLKPMKRGGGRRYYRPEDLNLLRGIRHLLHSDGYTIKGVQKILREQGVEAAKAAAHQGKNKKQALPEAGLIKTGARASKRAKRELKGAAKVGDACASNTSKSKGAPTKPSHPVMPAKTFKAVERAIAELKACRDILQPVTLTFKARSVPAKPRRSRAAR